MLLSNYSQPVCPLNSLKKPENKNHQSHHIWPHKWSLVLWDQKEVVKICSSTLCKVCHLSDLFWPEFGFLAHHLKQGFCAWVKKMCLTVFPWNICVRHIDPMQVYSKEGVTLFNNLCDLKNSYLWDELVILGLGWNCSLYFRMRRVTFLAVLKHSPSPPPFSWFFFSKNVCKKCTLTSSTASLKWRHWPLATSRTHLLGCEMWYHDLLHDPPVCWTCPCY